MIGHSCGLLHERIAGLAFGQNGIAVVVLRRRERDRPAPAACLRGRHCLLCASVHRQLHFCGRRRKTAYRYSVHCNSVRCVQRQHIYLVVQDADDVLSGYAVLRAKQHSIAEQAALRGHMQREFKRSAVLFDRNRQHIFVAGIFLAEHAVKLQCLFIQLRCFGQIQLQTFIFDSRFHVGLDGIAHRDGNKSVRGHRAKLSKVGAAGIVQYARRIILNAAGRYDRDIIFNGVQRLLRRHRAVERNIFRILECISPERALRSEERSLPQFSTARESIHSNLGLANRDTERGKL